MARWLLSVLASMLTASQSRTTALPELSSPPTTETNTREMLNRSSRAPKVILCLVAAFALLGIGFGLWLRTVPAGNPDPRLAFNVFYLLFSRHEPAGLFVVALFSLVSAFVLFRRKTPAKAAWNEDVDLARWLCPAVAVIAFAIAAIGTQTVFHDYMLTADEYLADFQARIFLRGKIQAEVPAALVDAVRVIKPTYVEYFPSTHSWNATYLPVYAAMRAVFQYADLQALLNPFLAAVTVLALYGAARNIWPESKTNALVAVALMAGSSQFLLMSMTAYAMPAHLALNTIWLWLYSRPDHRRFYLAPVIGVLALGLHQPFFHALFAAPFLLRLVLRQKWRTVLIFGAIYALGCAGWIFWWMHYRSQFGTSSATTVFRLFNPRMAIIQPMNLLLIIGWGCLATPLLAVLGARRFFHLPAILQDAAISCVLTFGFYYFFFLDQAHGWGYRYFHGALSCLVLVAVAGWNQLAESIGRERARLFLVAGLVASLLVQFPIRCIEAETFVRPFAHAADVLHAMPMKTVALDAREAWYSADLIRNDPFLENRPLIVSIYGLTPQSIAVFQKMGSVRFINRDMLSKLEMHTERRSDYGKDPFTLGRGK